MDKHINIYKYPLEPIHLYATSLTLPADSKVLSVGVQNNIPVVWINTLPLEPGAKPTSSDTMVFTITCVWTGKLAVLDMFAEYIGTAQLLIDDQPIVCHYYLTIN